MSYLKYANLCSDMVRAALVPEMRAKARTREIVHYKEAIWKDGKPEKQSEPLPWRLRWMPSAAAWMFLHVYLGCGSSYPAHQSGTFCDITMMSAAKLARLAPHLALPCKIHQSVTSTPKPMPFLTIDDACDCSYRGLCAR